MTEPIENPPSLSALKAAVGELQLRANEITRDVEVAAVRVRLLAQQVGIIAECMDLLLGDQPPCPDARFPELNHHDEE